MYVLLENYIKLSGELHFGLNQYTARKECIKR